MPKLLLEYRTISLETMFHEVQWVVDHEERKNLTQLALKTSEECGEMAQAVLSFTGAPGCEGKGKTREDVDEEALDTIFCAAAVLFRGQPRSNFALSKLMQIKFDKWREKILEAEHGKKHPPTP